MMKDPKFTDNEQDNPPIKVFIHLLKGPDANHNEIFGFPTKEDAMGFIQDLKDKYGPDYFEWAISEGDGGAYH